MSSSSSTTNHHHYSNNNNNSWCQVYCICIAEFDILKGNTLSYTYPTHIDLNNEYQKNIGDMCLMDGSHMYKEDMSYLFLKMTPNQQQAFSMNNSRHHNKSSASISSPTTTSPLSPTNTNTNSSSSSSSSSSDDQQQHQQQQYIYGTILFQNKKDDTVKRGAIQKSLVLFSQQPIFSVWEPMMRCTLNYIMNHSPNDPLSAMKLLFDTVKSSDLTQKLSISLFNQETFTIKKPVLTEHDAYLYMGNVSLLSLVKRFKNDVMHLWYALLCNKRIMVIGTPGKQVANCCMSCPLLVHPCCYGFDGVLTPYVPLTDLDTVLTSKRFICGSTNQLFETRQDWWDVCASFSSNQIIISKQFRPLSILTARDKEFMMNVLSGIEDGRGEQWVRQQFSQMTLRFFQMIKSDTLPKTDHMQLVVNTIMVQTEWWDTYQSYVASVEKEKALCEGSASAHDRRSAVDLFRSIHENQMDQEVLDRVRTVFELSKVLDEDISQVNELLSSPSSSDIIVVVSGWLKDDNSQFRKYAASIMASFAGCVKGLLTISSQAIQKTDDNKTSVILESIIDLLTDDMPNVRSRGTYTVYKMSNLLVGCKVLLTSERNFEDTLRKIILSTSDDTMTRTYAALSLAQLYQYMPDAMIKRMKDDWIYEIHDLAFVATDIQLQEALYRLLSVVLPLLNQSTTNSSDQFRYSMQQLPANPKAVQLVASMRNKYKLNEALKKCQQELTEHPHFPLHLSLANAVFTLTQHMTHWKKQGHELYACSSAQFLTTLCGHEYCKSQILTYGVLENMIIPVLQDKQVTAFSLCVLHLLLALLSRYEDVTHQFNQFGGIADLSTFILNNFHNPLLSQYTQTAIGCLKIALLSLSRIEREVIRNMYENNDMYDEEFEYVKSNPLHLVDATIELHQNCYIQLMQQCTDKLTLISSNALTLGAVSRHSTSSTPHQDTSSDDYPQALQLQRSPSIVKRKRTLNGTDIPVAATRTSVSSSLSLSDEDDYEDGDDELFIEELKPSMTPIVSSRMTQFFAEMNKCRVDDLLRDKLNDALSTLKQLSPM